MDNMLTVPESHSVKGLRRRQYQPLWDKNTITSAGATTAFFGGSALSNKTLQSTNVIKSFELPWRERYECWGIRLVPEFRQTTQSATLALALFYNKSAVQFKINNRPVLDLPALIVTGGCGLEGLGGYAMGTANSHISAIAHNGVSSPGAIIAFDEPFVIDKGETFGVDLVRDASVGLVKFIMCVVLEGYIWKTIQ